jgi:glycosyltransferase involved in cell wall biosynthesis
VSANQYRTILIVAYDFPPHGAIGTMRTLRLVRHLSALGWRITVLTGDPKTYLPSTPMDESSVERIPAGVEVIRAAAMWRSARVSAVRAERPDALSSAAKPRKRVWPSAVVRAKAWVDALTAIPDREAAWWLPAVRAGLRAHRSDRPDIIYSSAPPWTGQLVAYALAGRLGSPWVADFRDPWARLPWRENRPWLVRRAATLFEDITVRRAAAVVFTTGRIRDDVAAHHDSSLAAKFHVVPNGCDVEEFRRKETLAHSDRFVLLHAGSLYGGRDPRPLMRAIAKAVADGSIDRRQFQLKLIGMVALDGIDLPRTRDELGLHDVVEIVPRVSRAESLTEMMAASALLLMQPGHPLSVPAKAYEYLATGRPVLAIADEGETADLIRRSNGGIVVAQGDERGMAAALADLVRSRTSSCSVDPSWFDGQRRSAEIAGLFEAILGERGQAQVAPSSPAVEVARRA